MFVQTCEKKAIFYSINLPKGYSGGISGVFVSLFFNYYYCYCFVVAIFDLVPEVLAIFRLPLLLTAFVNLS